MELVLVSLVSQASLVRIAMALAHAETGHATTVCTVSVSVALVLLTCLGKVAMINALNAHNASAESALMAPLEWNVAPAMLDGQAAICVTRCAHAQTAFQAMRQTGRELRKQLLGSVLLM